MVEAPENISVAYADIEAEEFGTVNYKLDLYDKIILDTPQIINDEDMKMISVKATNPTEEVIFSMRIIFKCCKNQELVDLYHEHPD